jgi:uncharacterized protein
MAPTIEPLSGYQPRVVDGELRELLADLPAVAIEGPKGVGKTATAEHFGATIHRLDDPAVAEVIRAQSSRLITGAAPIVIDEWQRYPPSWDLVRRAVDADGSPGRFILTGSATPSSAGTHSGAGRIVTIRVRPLTLPERGLAEPTVSLASLLSGDGAHIDGSTAVTLDDYVTEILAGGFPGIRFASERARKRALDGYLDRIVDTELRELGVEIRHPGTLRRWLTATAAATSTTTSYDKIRNAASAGESTPAKTTTIPYREALERLWILEPLHAWAPTTSHLSRLTHAPKHHLTDPALAARLVGVGAGALLDGRGPDTLVRDGTYLGALFESLATLSVRVFAQPEQAGVSHFRTRGGEREVDLIVERDDHRVVAIEVKLAETVTDHDVRHLVWLRERLGHQLLDAAVLTTGKNAYRRADGIGVIPLALLGP